MIRQGKHFVALAAVGALLLVACGSDSKGPTTTKASTPGTPGTTATTAGGGAGGTTAAPATSTAGSTAASSTATTGASDTTTAATGASSAGWTVKTDNCPDPAVASAPIAGTLTIGSAQPLSGTPAVAFAPVKDGFELYIKYANDQKLIPGITLKTDIRDDQYDATQTPGVVSSLIDGGVNIFSGIIGTPNNLAVRDTLNQECIPQLLNLTGAPEWGNAKEFPWTTGALVPYDIEAKIYAKSLKGLIGDGGTVGMFTVNSEFGKTYADAFKAAAKDAGLKIVVEKTIEPTDQTPPTNQIGALASAKPMAVMAVPLGTQCPTFLKELVNAKAANPDWKPVVFLTNTCASRLLISLLAAGAGDGVYTSGNLVDPADPKFAALPGVKLFTDTYNAAGLKGDLGTTGVGWSIAESTVKILIAAQISGTLSRKSIIEAARDLEYVPSLAREGTKYKMNGEKDGFTFQSLTVLQWNEASKTFTEIGKEDTEYES